jgi:hypothetical protein
MVAARITRKKVDIVRVLLEEELKDVEGLGDRNSLFVARLSEATAVKKSNRT